MNAKELLHLPELSVIVDGDGLARQKHNGKWRSFYDKPGLSSLRVVNPEHCRQPVRLIHRGQA